MFYENSICALKEAYDELLPGCICKNWNYFIHAMALSSRKYTLDTAIKMCMDDLNHDPIDILTSYLWDLQIIKMQCSTNGAKIVFGNAVNIVQELIDILKLKFKL